MKSRYSGAFVVVLGVLFLVGTPNACAAPSIVYLFGMDIVSISADGRRIVGRYGGLPAYCETVANARPITLPLLPRTIGGKAWGVSGDGSLIVGTASFTGDVQRAWRWTELSGTQELPDLPGDPTICDAMGVSDDGQVIVGSGRQSHIRPVRWRAPFLFAEDLGTLDLPGYTSGAAVGISSDGLSVAATAYSTTSAAFQAAIWREETGLVGLGYLSDQFTFSEAEAISADGRVVVGYNKPTPTSYRLYAYRWDAESGQVPLGNYLPEPSSAVPTGLTQDGAVVIGHTRVDPPTNDHPWMPFIWSSAGGMRPLEDVLVNDYRIVLGNNRHILTAEVISRDGRIIVGTASNGGGAPLMYVATLDPFCVADVDNGSGTGIPDGGVSIDDLLLYLRWYNLGSIRADVDNGTFTGTRDSGVSIDDLLYFLARYAAGC